jgi:hypothetical protein
VLITKLNGNLLTLFKACPLPVLSKNYRVFKLGFQLSLDPIAMLAYIFYYWGDPDLRKDCFAQKSTCNYITQIPAKAGISLFHHLGLSFQRRLEPLKLMKFQFKLYPNTIDLGITII